MGHSAAASARTRVRARPRAARRPAAGGVRWDRVARAAFLLMLLVVALLYASPIQHWFQQRETASEHTAEVQRLEAEHDRLTRRAKELTSPLAIEREARRLGMVKQGERSYVVQGLPGDR